MRRQYPSKEISLKCDNCGSAFSVPSSYYAFRERKGASVKFCSRKCMGESQRTALNKKFFENNSIPVPHSGCWIWTGSIWDSNGYGRISRNKSQGGDIGAHRASFIAQNGPIPAELVVRHSCDIPLCVNPEHLSLGTVRDNKNDAVLRRRHAHGSSMWNALLTEKNIPEIRALLAQGVSQSEVARKFGVPHGVIFSIDHGVTWKHVP